MFKNQVLYVGNGGGYVTHNSQGDRFFLQGDDQGSLRVNAIDLFVPK